MPEPQTALTLSLFAARIKQAVSAAPGLRRQWVTAETLDLRQSGQHVYLELIEKDPDGRTVAKVRAAIWATARDAVLGKFAYATGARLASGMKVMVLVSADFHPAYGLTLSITDIDPVFTLGDIQRRRREILQRLASDGILELNRSLPWPAFPQRVAIISAPGAAGYGDFIKRIYTNPYGLRFVTQLFPAVMQGERTAPTVMAALDEIYAQSGMWDCVVIIRGGGSTADLVAFDHYELAAAIAQFDIPVIAGIGHDRDITVVDYVCARRAETPTAAADFLVSLGAAQLGRLQEAAMRLQMLVSDRLNTSRIRLQACATALLQSVTDTVATRRQTLGAAAAALPHTSMAVTAAARSRLGRHASSLGALTAARTAPCQARLQALAPRLQEALRYAIAAARQRLESASALTAALGPEATLARGFTITELPDGSIATAAAALKAGDTIRTRFADGSVTSTVIP